MKNSTLLALIFRKIGSSNTSRLEAHVGFFRLLMKGFFGSYVLLPFDKSGFFFINNHTLFVEKHKQKILVKCDLVNNRD